MVELCRFSEGKDFVRDPISDTIRGLAPRNLSEILDDAFRRTATEPFKITGDVIERTLGEDAERLFYDMVGFIKGLSVYPKLRALYFAAKASSYSLPHHVPSILKDYLKDGNEPQALRQGRYYVDNTKVFSEVLNATGNNALTFYDVIIFREGEYPETWSPEDFEAWTEELCHVAQYIDRGVDVFLMSYATSSGAAIIADPFDTIKDICEGKIPEDAYWNNTLEKDAKDKARKVREDLKSRYEVEQSQDIRKSRKYRPSRAPIKPEWYKQDMQSFHELVNSLPSSKPEEIAQKTGFLRNLVLCLG